VYASSGRAKAKRWSPSARTGCNSHCRPTVSSIVASGWGSRRAAISATVA
jgi:hypothetical protein